MLRPGCGRVGGVPGGVLAACVVHCIACSVRGADLALGSASAAPSMAPSSLRRAWVLLRDVPRVASGAYPSWAGPRASAASSPTRPCVVHCITCSVRGAALALGPASAMPARLRLRLRPGSIPLRAVVGRVLTASPTSGPTSMGPSVGPSVDPSTCPNFICPGFFPPRWHWSACIADIGPDRKSGRDSGHMPGRYWSDADSIGSSICWCERSRAWLRAQPSMSPR